MPAAVRAAPPLIHSERSLYRQVYVYGDDSTRCLCFTRECRIGRQSCIDLQQPDRLMFEYTQMMLGALLLNPDPHTILIIGLGGGTLPRTLGKLLPNADIDVVEIDPAVVRVAAAVLRLPDRSASACRTRRTAAPTCGGCCVPQRYQLIMLDAYDQQYIPEHLLTQEFLRQVRSLLAPNGIVAANTFSSSRLYQNESVTYRAVFGPFYNLKSANRVILASNGQLAVDRAGAAQRRTLRCGFHGVGLQGGFGAVAVQHGYRLGSQGARADRSVFARQSAATARRAIELPGACGYCCLWAATASRNSCSLALTAASLSGPSRTMSFWPDDSDSIFGSAY